MSKEKRKRRWKEKEKVIMSFPYLISFHSAGKPFAPNLNWERNCSRIFSIKIKLQSQRNISGIYNIWKRLEYFWQLIAELYPQRVSFFILFRFLTINLLFMLDMARAIQRLWCGWWNFHMQGKLYIQQTYCEVDDKKIANSF